MTRGASMPEEQDWIENLKTIRQYLTEQFPGYLITEDSSDTGILHKFTMTNPKTYEQFKLKVGWLRLSGKSNNPEKTERSLIHGDVARKMRQQKGRYFYW
jgi:hypothetical protein